MTRTSSFLHVVAACGLLALGACANLDDQQQKMVSGGAIGAVVGTVGTAITGGCIPCGTAIGAVVGVAGGYIVDQLDKQTKTSSNNVQTAPAYNGNGAPAPSYNPPPPSAYGSPSSYNAPSPNSAPSSAYSSNNAYYGSAPVTTQ